MREGMAEGASAVQKAKMLELQSGFGVPTWLVLVHCFCMEWSTDWFSR